MSAVQSSLQSYHSNSTPSRVGLLSSSSSLGGPPSSQTSYSELSASRNNRTSQQSLSGGLPAESILCSQLSYKHEPGGTSTTQLGLEYGAGNHLGIGYAWNPFAPQGQGSVEKGFQTFAHESRSTEYNTPLYDPEWDSLTTGVEVSHLITDQSETGPSGHSRKRRHS